MKDATIYSVTLSPELFAHLSAESTALGVTMEWIVAALIADTLEAENLEPAPV